MQRQLPPGHLCLSRTPLILADCDRPGHISLKWLQYRVDTAGGEHVGNLLCQFLGDYLAGGIKFFTVWLLFHYRNPARVGDYLRVETATAEVGGKSISVYFRAVAERRNREGHLHDVLIAEGTAKYVVVKVDGEKLLPHAHGIPADTKAQSPVIDPIRVKETQQPIDWRGTLNELIWCPDTFISHPVFPADLNYNGTLFGGKIIELMFEGAAYGATRNLKEVRLQNGRYWTLRAQEVSFLAPGHLQDRLRSYATILEIGHHSITMATRLIATRPDGSEHVLATGKLVLCLVDKKGGKIEHDIIFQ